jgi:hypothetical protein
MEGFTTMLQANKIERSGWRIVALVGDQEIDLTNALESDDLLLIKGDWLYNPKCQGKHVRDAIETAQV